MTEGAATCFEVIFLVAVLVGLVSVVPIGRRRGWMVDAGHDATLERWRSHGHFFDRHNSSAQEHERV